MPQDFEDAFAPCVRYREREPGAAQNSGNLGIHLGRKSEHVDFLGTQQSALRNAVRPSALHSNSARRKSTSRENSDCRAT
jgi:hypothetical protein